MIFMDRVHDAPSDFRPAWPRMAAAGIALALLGAAAWRASGSAGAALLLALVLLVLASVGLLLGWRRTAALSAQLQQARVGRAHLDDVLDVWQWQTDREHRLTMLRPPRGHGPNVAVGMALWDHFKANDAGALRAQLDRHAPLDTIEGRHGASAIRGALLHGRSLTDSAGAFAGYAGIMRDLEPATTAAVPPEPATPVAAPAAPSVGRTDAEHESFSYTVSHDLRAPIRVVEGFTKIIKEDYGRLLDRVGNDHLDRVLGAAARMNGMIDALLALSKLSSQPLARQPVNLSQLASYVADDLRRQSPERQVTLSIEPELQVVGDPTLLRVVLENLLSNAWKYTGKNPDAHIWLERRAGQPDSFTVRDDGAGFDMRFAERLFGVFQRLHSANDFPGTGVGLASVQRIVRRHGGTIWGEAEVNCGARFHFTLPSA